MLSFWSGSSLSIAFRDTKNLFWDKVGSTGGWVIPTRLSYPNHLQIFFSRWYFSRSKSLSQALIAFMDPRSVPPGFPSPTRPIYQRSVGRLWQKTPGPKYGGMLKIPDFFSPTISANLLLSSVFFISPQPNKLLYPEPFCPSSHLRKDTRQAVNAVVLTLDTLGALTLTNDDLIFFPFTSGK